jgi:hypothetical protein
VGTGAGLDSGEENLLPLSSVQPVAHRYINSAILAHFHTGNKNNLTLTCTVLKMYVLVNMGGIAGS